MGLTRRRLGAAALAWAAGAAHADDHWTDTARGRTVPLRLVLPPGDAPVPVVLFSHGLGGNLDAGRAWSAAWAAAGIATLHLQHPGSDADVLRSGGLAALRKAAAPEQLLARAADVHFVLDELARRRAEPGWSRLRPDAVGMAGHSFGAHTTLAVAGQRYPRGGAALADPRPRAFAAFSPSPGDLAAVRRPVLCLTGSADGDPVGPHPRDDGRWRRAAFDALPAGAKAELWLDGADHMTFGGNESARRGFARAAAATAQAPRHRALVQAASTAWWRAQLLGEALPARLPGLGPADEWRRG